MKRILYNQIGENYNTTRKADDLIADTIFKALQPSPHGKYLDIGCGTGNYTIAMVERGLNMVGIEPSGKMLEIAKIRNKDIEWIVGHAEAIPVEDNLFDGIFGTLTLHHWTNISIAFKELYRVLKKGGTIVFFTSTPEQMNGYWLNHYFPKMLGQSIFQMPSFEKIKNAAEAAGFKILETEKYFVKDNLKDHFLYVGKNIPRLYFEESVRSGISSFAALADSKEIDDGLQQLYNDLKNNSFNEVKKAYHNDDGDYLFITIVK